MILVPEGMDKPEEKASTINQPPSITSLEAKQIIPTEEEINLGKEVAGFFITKIQQSIGAKVTFFSQESVFKSVVEFMDAQIKQLTFLAIVNDRKNLLQILDANIKQQLRTQQAQSEAKRNQLDLGGKPDPQLEAALAARVVLDPKQCTLLVSALNILMNTVPPPQLKLEVTRVDPNQPPPLDGQPVKVEEAPGR